MIVESDWQFLALVTGGGFVVAAIVVWLMFRAYLRMRAAERDEQARAEGSSSIGAAGRDAGDPPPRFFRRYRPPADRRSG